MGQTANGIAAELLRKLAQAIKEKLAKKKNG